MTTFEDGPAAGVTLELRRAPLFIRVVTDGTKDPPEWDALDLLQDEPRPGEVIWVYRRCGAAGSVHLDYRDKQGRRRGKWLAYADYRYYPSQPDGATARDTGLWRAWCQTEAKKGADDAREC